jgi:hypothetical protein
MDDSDQERKLEKTKARNARIAEFLVDHYTKPNLPRMALTNLCDVMRTTKSNMPNSGNLEAHTLKASLDNFLGGLTPECWDKLAVWHEDMTCDLADLK